MRTISRKRFRTRETADLFLTLFLQLLKKGGRAAIVLPDGFLFGEGMKTRLKEKLLETAISSAYLIRPRFSEQIFSFFAYAFLTSPLGKRALGLNTTAVGVPNTSACKMALIPFPVRTVREQKDIVDTLDELMAIEQGIWRIGDKPRKLGNRAWFGLYSNPCARRRRREVPAGVRRTASVRPACLRAAKAARVLAASRRREHRSGPA